MIDSKAMQVRASALKLVLQKQANTVLNCRVNEYLLGKMLWGNAGDAGAEAGRHFRQPQQACLCLSRNQVGCAIFDNKSALLGLEQVESSPGWTRAEWLLWHNYGWNWFTGCLQRSHATIDCFVVQHNVLLFSFFLERENRTGAVAHSSTVSVGLLVGLFVPFSPCDFILQFGRLPKREPPSMYLFVECSQQTIQDKELEWSDVSWIYTQHHVTCTQRGFEPLSTQPRSEFPTGPWQSVQLVRSNIWRRSGFKVSRLQTFAHPHALFVCRFQSCMNDMLRNIYYVIYVLCTIYHALCIVWFIMQLDTGSKTLFVDPTSRILTCMEVSKPSGWRHSKPWHSWSMALEQWIWRGSRWRCYIGAWSLWVLLGVPSVNSIRVFARSIVLQQFFVVCSQEHSEDDWRHMQPHADPPKPRGSQAVSGGG